MRVLVRVTIAVLGVLMLSAVSYALSGVTGGWSWLIVTFVFALVAIPKVAHRRSS